MPRTLSVRTAAALVAAALVSCAVEPVQQDAAQQPAQPPPSAPRQTEGEQAPPIPADTREEIIERGSGVFIGAVPERAAAEPSEGDINLRFQNTELKEFAAVVLGDLLGVNYIIDPAVSGLVTIQTSTPITSEELLPLFEEILAINGAALVRTDNLYRVVSLASYRGSAPLATPGIGGAEGIRTHVIPLRFIAAEEMRRILETVVGDPNSIRIDPARNLVIVTGTRGEVEAVRDAIAVFDVDWLRGMSLGLYPLDHVSPAVLEAELRQVLNAASGKEGGGPLDGLVRFVPLDRLGSLLVVSSTATALREVEVWIRRLDRPGESTDQRLYVYPVQNAKAVELAEILGGIFSTRSASSARSGVGSAASSTRLAPGLTPVQIGSDGSRPFSATESPMGAADTGDGGLLVSTNSPIEIIADDVRNALVILASAQDYQMIESAIGKLDVVPLQVLIEARILEVVLRDDLNYGVEWFFRNSLDARTKTRLGTLDLGSPGIGPLAPGFSYTIVDQADDVRFALNLLAEEATINVLSSPSLMALDNQTATINVGDEIPVPSRQSVSNIDPVSPTVNEISFRQTGVTLSVTPRVNASGLVTIDIRQQVSTAVTTTTSNLDAPTIQNREIESVVAVNSGDTIVLGGLIQTTDSRSEAGIPALRRIPGLGKLFSETTKRDLRTELIVLITPRVVRNREDARRITEEFRRNMPQLDAFEAERRTEAL